MITFNTNRPYTEKGQRIAAKFVNERIVFADIDRNIHGVINDFRNLTEDSIMLAYDHGHYTQGFYCLGLPTPTDDLALLRELEIAAERAPVGVY